MHYLEENYVQCALKDRKLGVLIIRLCRDFLRDLFQRICHITSTWVLI